MGKKISVHILSIAFILLVSVEFVFGQQCRYVTVPVCDGSGSSPVENIGATKGEKGDRGYSGKLGPTGDKGESGSKGDVGATGAKGDNARVEELQDYLMNRLNEMQTTLNELLLPPNCASSSVVGYQTLRSGEQVYCDGGWTVFQRRYDGSVNFQRNWTEYKNGFGNFSTEFWLGLDKLHEATEGRGCRFRADVWAFDNDHGFAEYSGFYIENEAGLYRLHIGGFSGIATDCFKTHDKMPFTTPDRDNDNHAGNCASDSTIHGPSGGWWFDSCYRCQFNAEWGRSSKAWHNNVWYPWKTQTEKLKASVMKFRCD